MLSTFKRCTCLLLSLSFKRFLSSYPEPPNRYPKSPPVAAPTLHQQIRKKGYDLSSQSTWTPNNNNRSDTCILIHGREKVSVLVDLNKILKLKNSWFINHFLHHFKTAPWWTLLHDQKNAFSELLPYPRLLQAQFIVDNSPSINKGNLVKRFWYHCDHLTKIPANHQFLLHFLSSCWNV